MSKDKRNISKDEATRLFLQHYDFVRRCAFRHAPSRFLQDDITHEVYIDFIEKHDQWDMDSEKIRPLLWKITRNIALQYWRKWVKDLPENVQKLVDYVWMKEQPKPAEEIVSLHEELLILETCLNKLKPENRELVDLLYMQNVPYSELIERTGRKANTIYSLMSRIRTMLHDCVERMSKVEVTDV